jgi:hypothetical protein
MLISEMSRGGTNLESANRTVDSIGEGGDRIAVHFSAGVLDEVRRLAVDGFNAFSHGGVETGGVLYGVREAECIRVASFAELHCEHASGPRFVLSAQDLNSLSGLLHPPDELEAVGWFRAHTRGGLELDDHDREVFEQYFSQPLSVALMLKPTHWGPASAALYVREHGGEVAPASAGEFMLEPPPARSMPATMKNEAATEAEPAADIQPAIAQAGEVIAPIERIRQTPDQGRAWIWALYLGTVIGAVAAFTYGSQPSGQMDLRAEAIVPGQVLIRWHRKPQPVGHETSGVLEIQDGDSVTRVPLDSGRVNAGTVTYSQLTGHIRVRMKIDAIEPGDVPAENTIDFIGAPPAQARVAEAPRDARGVAAEVAATPDPEPPARAAREEKSQTAPERPGRTPPSARSIPKAILVTDAGAAPRVPPPVLPTPPAVVPASPRSTGLPEFLSTVPPPIPHSFSADAVKTGRLIWTGVLARFGVIEIEGSHASVGSATGALPGTPLSLRVSPAEFTRDGLVVFTADRARNGMSEAPSKANGWNAMHLRFDEARAGALLILEAPNRSNDFRRLVVRNEGRDCSVVVVDWKTFESASRL